MSQMGRLIDRRLAKTLIILQSLMIPCIAILSWLIWGQAVAINATSGAIVAWLASCYFAWQSFRVAGASASKQMLANMYKGMIGKFVIVVVGFILILTSVKPLLGVALFCGFILIQSVSWFAPYVLAKMSKQ
ncbi:MAG: ATP synthase subunit I [Acinetobacter sp.]|nr:ATP synthase subunit I [Acinetobacter sp.]